MSREISNIRYVAFSDECSPHEGRYRSIGVCSCMESVFEGVSTDIDAILRKRGIGELKWQKVTGGNYRDAVKAVLNHLCLALTDADMRCDVIVWDVQDRRHCVERRDDFANFGRMLYHVYHHLMRVRPRGAVWRIHPDEHHGIDWDTANDCLEAQGRKLGRGPDEFRALIGDAHFTVEQFEAVRSCDHRLVQVADLFAGIGSYARSQVDRLRQWRARQNPTLDLFSTDEPKLSRSEQARFPILEYLRELCSKHGLAVNFDRHGYPWTPDPRSPVNFWHYAPQASQDYAPTRD